MDPDTLWDSLVGGDELEPGDARLADLPLGHRPHHDDPRISESCAQMQRLGQRRDAEGGGTPVERGFRDVDRAMPVPLRLHDRPELGALRGTQQRGGVPANRPEVESEARPLHVVDSRN